jgi:uncharacterized protein (TIGR03083 family)
VRQTANVSLWDEPVRDFRATATAEREQLLTFLAGLSADEWLAPTAAPGWAVRDVALHLLDDDLTWLSTQRDDELAGLVDMSDRRAFPQLLADKNQRWIDGARGMSRQVVAGLLRWSGEQVDSFHASQDLLGAGSVSWASEDPVPYWFNLAQEFTERWVHQQQMREAVGRVGDHEATLPEVLRTFVWAFPHQLPRDIGARMIEIAIADVGAWTLRPAATGWSLIAAPAAGADARLYLTADAAWRLLTGAAVPPTGITIEGDPRVREALIRVRSIIV